jgi:hypothetical protein
MPFPNISRFSTNPLPSPYARQMGASIAALLKTFHGRVPDRESNSRVLELAVILDRWSAGHALFDEVRSRYLVAEKAKDNVRVAQYSFEESCLQAMYNESDPNDPFDYVSPYWVIPGAIGLARAIGLSVETVLAVMNPTVW